MPTKRTIANQKWNEKNPEKWLELNRRGVAKYYETHKEERLQQMMNRYWYQKEAKRLRFILLDI